MTARAATVEGRRAAVVGWLGVVVFGRLYTVVLCDIPGRIFGIDGLCYTWIRGIPSYLWIELIFYGPVMWLALHRLTTEVFAAVPSPAAAARVHRRRHFVATAAGAIFLYGVGVHTTDIVEVVSRERVGVTDGTVYDLAYFLDEGVSHYIQFTALAFLTGWLVLFDRPGRDAHPSLALFLGVAHGVERSLGIVEGEKWLSGPIMSAWFLAAIWARRRRLGRPVGRELFVRYGTAMAITLPVGQALYYLRFGDFVAPSALSDGDYAEVAAAAVVVVAIGTVLAIALDRRWSARTTS